MQAVRFDHPAIGRDPVAFCENKQIAANHLAPGDPSPYAATDDERARTCEIAQRFESPFASGFLDDGNAHRKSREHGENQRLAQVAECEIDEAAGDKQRQHRFAQDIDHYVRDGPPPVARKFVRTLGGEPRLRLGIAEAGPRHVTGPRHILGAFRTWRALNHG